MRSHSFWACLAALALSAGARADDATYTIKVKHAPDVGKGIVIKSHDKETNSITVTDPDGKVLMTNKETAEKDEVYTETVIEKGEKQSKKFKRAYEKATRTADGKTTDLPYQGRTIVFEQKDGKYQAAAEGTPALDKKVLAGLAAKEDADPQAIDDAILPKKPVKVGDKWAVDIKVLAKAFGKDGGPDLDTEKSKGEVTLTKAFKKDGAQFGVLDMTLKLVVKSVAGLTFEPPATGELTGKLEIAIDGSSSAGTETSTNTLKGKAVMTQMGQKLTIELSSESAGTKTATLAK
jgi:hypothetical protein